LGVGGRWSRRGRPNLLPQRSKNSCCAAAARGSGTWDERPTAVTIPMSLTKMSILDFTPVAFVGVGFGKTASVGEHEKARRGLLKGPLQVRHRPTGQHRQVGNTLGAGGVIVKHHETAADADLIEVGADIADRWLISQQCLHRHRAGEGRLQSSTKVRRGHVEGIYPFPRARFTDWADRNCSMWSLRRLTRSAGAGDSSRPGAAAPPKTCRI